MFPGQGLLPGYQEQTVEALLGLGELGVLDLEHSRQLALPVHAGLIGRSDADQADACDHHQSKLDAKANQAAEQILLAQVGGSHRRPGSGGPGGGGLAGACLAGPLSGRAAGGMGVFAAGGTSRTAAGFRGGIEGSGGTGSHRTGLGS